MLKQAMTKPATTNGSFARGALSIALVALLGSSGQAGAQAFGTGPAGTIPGSSMSGARIVGTPSHGKRVRIPNADVFGDEFEERAYGKDYDDSFITPKVRQGTRRAVTNEERATEGRSDLNAISSGAFARQGPTAIGRSAVTRGSSFSRGGRARIVMPER